MHTMVALLRGVNVGGRTVRMDRLKSLFKGMGFSRVRTYIQSGNVLFDAAESPDDSLRLRIEEALRRALGFDVSAVILPPAELDDILSGNPFAGGPPQGGRVYITIFQEAPPPEAVRALPRGPAGADEFEARGRAVYIRCMNGYRDTVYSNAFFEKKLKIKATTRSLETLAKLASLHAEY
jgi:uncharacterized protein (DUF1697 family)